MKRKIHKYVLPTVGRFEISLPFGGTVIHVGLDPTGTPCMWVEFDVVKSARQDVRPFFIVGTGYDIPEEANAHLGTFVQGLCVWHLYD